MSDLIEIARQSLWQPAGLGEQDVNRTLGKIMSAQIDYADLYFQYARQESWSLDEGTVKSGNFSIEQGVGVRAVSGEKTGFAYSDELTSAALLDAAGAARSIALGGPDAGAINVSNGRQITPLYDAIDPIDSMPDADKVALLREVEQIARAADPRVVQAMVSLAAVQDTVLIARSDGLLAADVRPLVRLNVSVIVEHNGTAGTGLGRRWRTIWTRLLQRRQHRR